MKNDDDNGIFGVDWDGDGKVDWADDAFTMMLLDDEKNGGSDGGGGSGGGCYVATCIYGSYDCPQVWTLRRFRDYRLAETLPGRCFIHIYYAISPMIIKLVGKDAWFHHLLKTLLDRFVSYLHARGVEDTPYRDRLW